jgi:titin
MSLTWQVPFNGASPITSFFWKLADAASNQDTDISGTFTDPRMNSLGSELTLTTVISRLPTTVPYYFLIQAINEIGSGAFSNPSYSVPFPPTFTAVVYGNSTLTYFWTAPARDGGKPILQHTIYLYDAISNALVRSVLNPVVTQPILLTGLTNGTSYYAILRCWNYVGQGVSSARSTTAKPMRPPDAPTIVNISANDAELSVVWNAPANNGGDTVSSYNLYLYDVTAGSTLVSTTPLLATPLFKIVHGLTNGHTYYVQISALNGATNQHRGEGPPATSARVTPTGVPQPPTITSLTPADSLVTLIWIPPTNDGGLPVLTFTIYVSIGSTSVYLPISVTAVAGQSSYTQVIDGLTNGTVYDIAVKASNGNGESQPASRQATPVGVPSAPTITHIESNWVRIKLDWIPPINNGGAPPLTNYYIYLYYADTNALAKVVDTNSGTQLTTLLTDLSFGTCYYAKVSAWNNRGEGPKSAPSEVVCVGHVPDAPVILSAVGEYASVFTRWSVPPYDGGFPILYYNVYTYYENTLLLALGAQSTILTFLSFLGLTNGIQYLMRVSAVNAVGEGPQSDPYGPVTPLPTLCGQTTVYGTDHDIYGGSGTVWPQQPYPSTNGPRLTGANLTEEQQAWNFFELVEAYDASVRVRMSGANYVPPPAVGSGGSSPWYPILNQDQQLLYRNGQVIHEVMFPCYCWRSQRYLGISKDPVTNVYPQPSL